MGVRFTRISKITGENGYTFYCLSTGYDIAEDGDETIIGRLPDGKFVKYFDTTDISKRYFGSHWGVYYKKIVVRGDTITIYYDRTISSSSFNPTKVEESGEFRFRWDETAKWFSIEQMVY